MKPTERWQEVKEILYPALEMGADERSSFLTEKCGDDADLRREIESLIAAHNEAPDRLESPAVERMAGVVFNQSANDMIGRDLGHYEIVKKIGAGGMGEVYLARDTRLDRKVALKFLPTFFTQDPVRLRRFQQEARAASALNHPNILTIHEVGHVDSAHYIATEFVDGESLRDYMARKPLKITEALEIATQVAGALAAAHEAGIIHRDIKPENIMIRKDGIVKVVDFGLAKLAAPTPRGSEDSTMVNTDDGIVMGTAQYMSPEQARGIKVDARTDMWSLGCVLYEMLAGRSPFHAETTGDVIVSVLERDPPPLTRIVPDLPAELDWIVKKAIRKERDERYQTGKELLSDLRSIKKGIELEGEVERTGSPELHITGNSTRPSGPERLTDTILQPVRPTSSAEYIVGEIKKHKRAAVLIPLLLLVSAAVILYLLPQRDPSAQGTSLRNTKFLQLTDQPGPEYFPSISPDGKEFIYAGLDSENFDIYLRKVGGKNPINLTKDSPEVDTQPAFSPDGERIAFRSGRDGGGIFIMGATGENVRRLTNFGFNPAWSPDGKQVACADEGIVEPGGRNNLNSRVWAIDVATGEKRQITEVDAVSPNWSPNGSRIAYQGRRNSTQRDIWTIPAGGGEPVEVTNDEAMDWNPVWSPAGNYLYFVSDRGGSMNLWRVPIEEQTGKVLGQFEAVTTPSPYISHLSFSRDGRRMLYANVISSSNIQRVEFDPVREAVVGQPARITQGSRRTMMTSLAPDGEWLAFDVQGERQDDIFIVKRDGTGLRQLTDDQFKDRGPRWSPDGKRIAFFSDRSGKWEVWMIDADGSGMRQVTYTDAPAINPIWSPDGTRLVYRNSGKDPAIIETAKSWHDQTPQILPAMTDPPRRINVNSWSPDGRQLAGVAQGSEGIPKGIVVYSLASQTYEALTDSGAGPAWLSDNRRLLFVDRRGIWLVDRRTKEAHELLTVGPDRPSGLSLARDDRAIYFSLISEEADVWMMTLE